MISFEEMESCIEEWFTDHYYEGIFGIAKTYATIMKEAEKQLGCFAGLYKEKEIDDEQN